MTLGVKPLLSVLLLTSLAAWADPSALCKARAWRTLLGTRGGYAQSAASIDEALRSPLFNTRFAAFVNSKFNPEPGRDHPADSSFYVAQYVMTHDLPWKDTFVGRFKVPNKSYPVVEVDPNGLGYFTSEGWLQRYAGNESEGYLIVAANRVLQNTIGTVRTAAANNADPNVPNDAQGRRALACAGCHYEGPYALDYVARLFPRKTVVRGQMVFVPTAAGPQPVLNRSVDDLRQLVETLVASDAFNFWSCRLAFEFVYGRAEYACEAPLFDRCVDAFQASGKIQDGIKVLVEDPSFCGGLP